MIGVYSVAGGVEYTPELAESICQQLAEGKSLREVCKGDDMPSEAAVRKWALKDYQGFGAQYTRAREVGYYSMMDEIIEISDDGSNDWMMRNGEGEAGWSINGEHVQRSRLRIDTRKWLLSKVLPKVCGDKLDLSNSDKTLAPQPAFDVSKLSKEAKAEILAAYDAARAEPSDD